MTKPFRVHYTCSHCGQQTTAETGFGRWLRDQKDEKFKGIVRTDTDHWFLRYKTALDGRAYQLLMLVEVKERGAEPDPAQMDVLHFTHQLLVERDRNMYGARTYKSIRMKSVKGLPVLVKSFGVHLLQFENTSPWDSSWIKWDRKVVTTEVLGDLLALERRPDRPDEMMIDFLRNRHRKIIQETMSLF